MKAVVFYEPQHYQVENVPNPHITDREILVKVSACGLCGSDLRTLKHGHRKVTPPFTLGHEISGEVVEIGINSNSPFKVGSKIAIAPPVYCGTCVYCRQQHFELCENFREIGQTWAGGLAEFIIIPEEALSNGVIHKIPDSLDPSHASLAEPLAACLHAIDRVDFQNVNSAAIFGAGTIGCLLLQLMHMKGVNKVVLLDPNEYRLDIAKKLNADLTINNSVISSTPAIKEIIGEKGVDVIFTATAAPIVQNQALELANKAGQIVIFSGLPKGHSVINADFNIIHYKCLKLIGSSIYAPHHHQKALDLIADKSIQVKKMISVFPLSDFAVGVKSALQGKTTKAVFLP